jgi:hypothetical protein
LYLIIAAKIKKLYFCLNNEARKARIEKSISAWIMRLEHYEGKSYFCPVTEARRVRLGNSPLCLSNKASSVETWGDEITCFRT